MNTNYAQGVKAFEQWIASKGVRRTYTTDEGRKTDEGGWDHFAWTVTLANRDKTAVYAFPFMQGTAHTKPPTTADLVSSLLLDAQTVMHSDGFEDWARGFGYDSDSTKARATFDEIGRNNDRLRKLFGTANLEALLDEAEPLMEAAGL